jgi:hypothetical protein
VTVHLIPALSSHFTARNVLHREIGRIPLNSVNRCGAP